MRPTARPRLLAAKSFLRAFFARATFPFLDLTFSDAEMLIFIFLLA
jgi:hypothetical protein